MSYVNFSHTTAEVQDGDDVLHLDEKMETQDIEDKFEKIINRFNRLKSQKQKVAKLILDEDISRQNLIEKMKLKETRFLE